MKSHVDNFYSPIGSYDSAQIFNLIGIYILEHMGLYQDDGIIFIPDSNGPKSSKIY